MLSTTANAIVRMFLAPTCAACDELLEQPLTSPVCPTCWRLVAPVSAPWCSRCGDELGRPTSGVGFLEQDFGKPTPEVGFLCARCVRHPPRFDVARSAGLYEGSLREVIQVFKYQRRRTLAEPLGRMMRQVGADLLHDADAVVPVPLHPIRAFQRGFNQADDLARQLGRPVWRALRRRRHGPPQASLPATERHENLTSAFALNPAWALGARLRRHTLRDRVVVVVDDVMTTGATLDACSEVLLSGGVRSVRVLTAARAVAAPRLRPTAPPLLSGPPRR